MKAFYHSLSSARGASLIEVLVAATVGAILFTGYAKSVDYYRKSNIRMIDRTAAQFYAADIAEFFRSMTAEQMTSYLKNLYEMPIACEQIPGDCSLDGKVDHKDIGCLPPLDKGLKLKSKEYLQWEQNVGRESPCGAPYCAHNRGDFNRDGKVDALDYTVWETEQMGNCTISCLADANKDEVVDSLDEKIWKRSKGWVSTCGSPIGESPAKSSAYRLCEKIYSTQEPPLNKRGMAFMDSVGNVSGTSGLKRLGRSYELHIVKMKEGEISERRDLCGTLASELKLSNNEFYQVRVSVNWDEAKGVTLSSIVPIRSKKLLVFVSSKVYTGNFGGGLTGRFDGPLGAKKECQSLAESADLKGEWWPIMSSGSWDYGWCEHPWKWEESLPDVYDTKGNRISTSRDFWKMTHENPIQYDENGNDLSNSSIVEVWTGFHTRRQDEPYGASILELGHWESPDFVWVSGRKESLCMEQLDPEDQHYGFTDDKGVAEYGFLTKKTSQWLGSDEKAKPCTEQARIYCIQREPSEP